MPQVIIFETFSTFFDQLNSTQLIDDNLKNQFYELIPLLFHYEEEGEKLNFSIIFIRDLEKNRKLLPSFIFQKIITVEKEKLNFSVNEIINQKRGITPATALRLAKYFSMSADFWLNLQIRWDLYRSMQAEAKDIAMIQPLAS
ncbi:MAG: antitoxin HigA [Campylobacterota bacterium]|nr:antitoxin HigA [Campylobacterota bacterium]